MAIIKLKESIKNLTSQPGIYIFKDSKNKPLYIGKASNLKNRISQYVKINDTRLNKMLSNAKTISSIKTESDIEALILESKLIKKFRPQFNIVMRDDKQYFYIGFSNENFPKIFITHQPWTSGACSSSLRTGSVLIDLHAAEIPLSAIDFVRPMEPYPPTGIPTRATPRLSSTHFIGPFTDGNALKTTLRFLRSIFPYCTCKQTHHNFCLNYHIGKCLGYCCLKSNSKIINAKNSHNMSVRTCYENLTYSSPDKLTAYKKNIRAIMDILSGKKSSLIKKLEKKMTQLAKKGELESAIELREKLGKLKRVFENAKIIPNVKYLISGTESATKSRNISSKLARLLKFDRVPTRTRIEGYDVSNIQGAHAVGSMVTFVNGQPDKNLYRKFKIKQTNKKAERYLFHDRSKNTTSGGDTEMLKEILERRFKHSEWPFPDLILVDGGKQQLRATEAVVNHKSQIPNHKQIPIIALTKNKKHIGEKIHILGRKTPLPLTKLSPADKNLLLAIDSEAHRFAIGYYRKLHRKLYK